MGRFFGGLKQKYIKAKVVYQKTKSYVDKKRLANQQRRLTKDTERKQAMERVRIKAEEQTKYALTHAKRLEAQTRAYRAAVRARETKAEMYKSYIPPTKQLGLSIAEAGKGLMDFGPPKIPLRKSSGAKRIKKHKGIHGFDYM